MLLLHAYAVEQFHVRYCCGQNFRSLLQTVLEHYVCLAARLNVSHAASRAWHCRTSLFVSRCPKPHSADVKVFVAIPCCIRSPRYDTFSRSQMLLATK